MHRNPRKAIVGPTTILRVENISGLNPSDCELPPPVMSKKPITIISPQHPIKIKFNFENGRFRSDTLSIDSVLLFLISVIIKQLIILISEKAHSIIYYSGNMILASD